MDLSREEKMQKERERLERVITGKAGVSPRAERQRAVAIEALQLLNSGHWEDPDECWS